MYKPISVEELIPVNDSFDCMTIIKRYMAKYGVDRVRGELYSTCKLDMDTKIFLTREIRAAQSLCLACGRDHGLYCQKTEIILDSDDDESDSGSENTYIPESFRSDNVCNIM